MSTQIDSQFGIGLETTYGTPVAPTRFFESEGKMDTKPKYVDSSVLQPFTRVKRLDQHIRVKQEVSGDQELDIPTSGFGFLLHAAFGNSAISQLKAADNITPVQAWQQIHTLSLNDFLPSYTIQELLPLLGGAQKPHSFTGCQVDTLEIDAKAAAAVTAKISWSGRDIDTTQQPAAASYPDDQSIFTFISGSLGYQGTLTPPTATALASLDKPASTNVTAVTVTVKNGLDGNGFTLGGQGLRQRPQALGIAEVSVKLTVEFTDTILRDAFLDGTPLPLLLTFRGEQDIAPGIKPALQIILPAVAITSGLPQSNGGDVISVDTELTALDDGSHDPLTIALVSGDSAF
ncbi:MAG: phage tail tube protein [Bifidobacterium tibiigranuli]|jgi:hypothetical protein|nr:phage tail tube protein [Bifidobacterium tibiigranuli]MCI1797456.1 phage tail tube protein [Bifidobacterium tibiigranuli]